MKISKIILQQTAITKNPEYELCLRALSYGIPIKLTHFLIRQIEGNLYSANANDKTELAYSDTITWEYLWNYSLNKISLQEIEDIRSNLEQYNLLKNKSIFIWEFEKAWFQNELNQINVQTQMLIQRRNQLKTTE